MGNSDHATISYDEVRRLAAEDPLNARRQLLQLLESDSGAFQRIMARAAAPGEGRVRQVVANVLRGRDDRAAFARQLAEWRVLETDEFTRRAIDAALAGVPRPVAPVAPRSALADSRLVEAYRYASSRIKHQLRNALMEPMGLILRLRTSVEGVDSDSSRAELTGHVGALDDALSRIARMIEFDVKDGFFETRLVALAPWLKGFNDEYGKRFRPMQLQLQDDAPGSAVRASDHLLNTTFWNLWINSQQAIGDGGVITVRIRHEGTRLAILVSDNGAGLSPGLVETAFRDSQPRAGHRGRGLLEVQDAVEQLHGEVSLVQIGDGSWRVQLHLPTEGR